MKELTQLMQTQFNKMCATGILFRSNITGHEIYELYLKSFNSEDNPVFRDPNSSLHNCNLCNNFIRRYGNIVAIDANTYRIMSIWDIEINNEYTNSVYAISNLLRNSTINTIFIENYDKLNTKLNYERVNKNMDKFQLGIISNTKEYTKDEANKFGVVSVGERKTFEHLNLSIPKLFINFTNASIESITALHRDNKNVFKRALDEISLDTLLLAKDLIIQGSLLNGDAHLYKIEKFIVFATIYDTLLDNEKDNWCWLNSYNLDIAKFRNELIGVLCVDLSKEDNLDKACQEWNKRIDPSNYMKAVAPITKSQIEAAKVFVTENGYEASFIRRMATIDDIKVSEIKHINNNDSSVKTVTIFDDIIPANTTKQKVSDLVIAEEMAIDTFMNDVLPTCTSIEALLLNNHYSNMVTLTTAIDKDSKPIFKYSNNYSKTFNGNLAGNSLIKEAVKSRGGNIEGVLNIRLSFPDTTDDYDLYVREPNGNNIYYSNVRYRHESSGMLDLDAQGIDGKQPPEKRVENVTFTDINKMPEGSYEILINNDTGRGLHTKFKVEIEYNNEITLLELKNTLSSNKVLVAKVVLKNHEFTTLVQDSMNILSSNTISRNIYGLESNCFHKVNLICLSPNHWNTNNIGNKHYLFMLDKCKAPNKIRSFHNEDLIPELLQHRKVLEVLGTTTMVESTDNQLSGLGFNATIRDELILKLNKNNGKIIKIKF